MKKSVKFLSTILSIIMLLSCFSLSAFAMDGETITNAEMVEDCDFVSEEITTSKGTSYSDVGITSQKINHQELKRVYDNTTFNTEEALRFIETAPKVFTSEFVITVDEVLESIGDVELLASSVKSGEYEKKMDTGTPGVSLNVRVEYTIELVDGKYIFTDVQGYLSIKKSFWGTLWATYISVDIVDPLHYILDEGNTCKITTYLDFTVYADAYPATGVSYREFHEMSFVVGDVV